MSDASKVQDTQDNKPEQETQKDMPASDIVKSARTVQTPMGAAIVAEGSDLTAEEIQAYFDKTLPGELEALNERIDAFIADCLKSFAEQPDMEKITAVFPDAKDWTENPGKSTAFFVFVCLSAVLTYIDILPDYLKKNDIEPSIIKFATTLNPETNQTPLEDFLTWTGHRGESETAPESLIEIMAQRPKDLPAAVDKLNRNFWSIGKMPANGMFDGKINTKPGNPKKPIVYYMFDARKALARFPDLAAEITEYDESVLSGVAAMLDIGQNYMTPDQIYYSMGYTGTPGKTDRKKIDDAFNKFTSRLVLSNKAEREAGLKYKKFEYDGDFLPFERVKGVRINGKDVDTAYHVYDYPAILRFAKDRDQLPRIPLEVKQISLNRTPFINKIEKYLINRVLNAKDGILSERILWTALYEECGAGERKQRLRARKYAGELLDHYTAIKWIKGYKTDEKGVILEVTKKKKNGKGKNSGNARRIQG